MGFGDVKRSYKSVGLYHAEEINNLTDLLDSTGHGLFILDL